MDFIASDMNLTGSTFCSYIVYWYACKTYTESYGTGKAFSFVELLEGSRKWSSVVTLFYFCRTAAAIRTASMTCLQALLRGRLLTAQQLDQLLVDLLPKVGFALLTPQSLPLASFPGPGGHLYLTLRG